MRLVSLALERYGPFTDRQLAFRPDARLHVVLGANEAGKSSALAAVTDLLFGTRDTRYEFLHREAGLRIGARIVARDGRELAFHRRRGRQSTLSDGDNRALPDDALAPFLGGLTRSVFCNAFGMDSELLRRGAEEMLKSEGEVGAALFAAASGLRGLRDAARALDGEAAAIFTPAARTRRMNDLIKRYDAARKAAGTERVGTDAWRKLEAGLEEAEASLSAITERRRAIATDGSRLRRLRAVAPVLAILDGHEAEAQGFADLPEMDDATLADLVARVEAAGATAQSAERAAAGLTEAEERLAALPVDPALDLHAEAIEALIEGKAGYRKFLLDRPRIEREAADFERALAGLAVRLGLADADAVEAAQPSDMARARLRSTLGQGRALALERVRAESDLVRCRAERLALTKAHEGRAALVDPAPLRTTHEALRPALADAARRDDLAAEVAREAAAIEAGARRLDPALAPEALTNGALPTPQTIRRHAEGLERSLRALEAARDGHAALRAEIDDLADRMAERGGAARPDPAALAAARALRDAAWAIVRSASLGEDGAPSGSRLLAQVAAFERASAAADGLADRLLGDARRGAEQAADERRLSALAQAAEAAQARLGAAEAVTAEAQAAWRTLWAPLAPAPLPPSEMAVWHGTVLALLGRRDALAAKRADLASLDRRIEAIRVPLAALSDRLGLDGLAGLDVSATEAQVVARLRSLGETWDAARDALARLATARDAEAAAEAALARAVEREAGWQRDWSDALAGLALPATATLDMAEAALEAWTEVPGQVHERRNRQSRVAGMQREIAQYEEEVRATGAALGLDAGLPVGDAVDRLQNRLRLARERAVLRETRTDALDRAREAHDRTRLAAQAAQRALADTTARFAIAPEADLTALLRRLTERAALRLRARGSREELARAGERVPEASLREDLATLHPDAIEGRLAELAAEDEGFDQDGKVAFATRERLRAERARIEDGTGAETAAAHKSAAEIEIRETARRYVVLKLGSLLLSAAIDRHRVGRQDPLIDRAGALFQKLTGEVYEGIDQAFDDDDQPVLAGRRATGGRPVALGDMSEGTRDQLFLALRLAYLEDFSTRAEPAPFLGDDIFASFDDARTGHGLEALAAIGKSVQPILFTHHESVARMAERRLGAQADIIALG